MGDVMVAAHRLEDRLPCRKQAVGRGPGQGCADTGVCGDGLRGRRQAGALQIQDHLQVRGQLIGILSDQLGHPDLVLVPQESRGRAQRQEDEDDQAREQPAHQR